MTKAKTKDLQQIAPYERVCTSCQRVRNRLDFTGRRRMCNPCVELRIHNLVAPSDVLPADARPERGPLADPDTYDGAELQPYTGRPGAMDAFALPSLRGSQRVYRTGGLISLNSKVPE